MPIAEQLLETAIENKANCWGLAAIQIEQAKRIIVVRQPGNNDFIVMLNPMIIRRSKSTYKSSETCLSLEGTRIVKRHHKVYVSYTDIYNKPKFVDAEGIYATIIQHEIDHCNGVLV